MTISNKLMSPCPSLQLFRRAAVRSLPCYISWVAFVVASVYPKMTRTAYIHAQYSHAQCNHGHDTVYFVYNVLILMSRTVRTARNILDVVWRFGEIVVCLVCCFNTE